MADPNYDDPTGGMPPDWQPDPNWTPPEHWGYAAAAADAPPVDVAAVDPAAALPSLRTPVVSDLATGGAPPVAEPAPDPAGGGVPLQPGLGVPQAALDVAAAQPGALPLPVDPGQAPSIPPPDAITAADVEPAAAQPIQPEQLDVAPVTLADQWQRDPLHAPDAVAKTWAENASPVDLLDQQRRFEDARRTKLVLDQARIDENNLRQLRTDQDNRRKADEYARAKGDAIVADAVRLANTKTDPNRWMSTRTGGQRVAAFIAAIAGGLLQGRTGSARNAGMDMIQADIDRDVDAQKADIENGRYAIGVRSNAVAQEFARNGDLFHSAEALRLATYQAAINKMQAEQQNFDPRGTAFLNYALAIKDMQGRAATASEAMRKTIFDEKLKAEESLQKALAQAETARHNAQQIGLGYAQLDSARQDRQLARQDKIDAAAQARQDKQFARQEKLDEQQAKDIKERAIGGEVSLDENGQPRFGLVTKADGTTWIPNGTEAQLSKLQDQHQAVTAYIQTIDKIRRLGPEWLTNAGNSEKLQQLKQLMGNARLQAIKAKDLGVPTGHDIELAEDFIGTTDPTKLRSSLAGIIESRETSERDHNARLHVAGLDKVWHVPDTGAKGRTEAEGDAVLKDVLTGAVPDDPEIGARWAAELGGLPRYHDEATKWSQTYGYMLPSQVRQLEQWGEDAKGTGPGAARARDYLSEVAAKAEARSEARRIAAQLLTDAQASSISRGLGDEATAEPSGRNVARDAPPAPQQRVDRDSAGNPR